ncbi:hypothetical protein FQR65_LT05672 [Abscondita terminalis]|nr:hypothetical protein FQR65_LT05672 [Abscondita terminalis]
MTRVRAPNSHHRKRLAVESRHHSRSDDSHMFIVKLPPNPYYYTHNAPNAVVESSKKLAVGFKSNGKPGKIYHWNMPFLKKMSASRSKSRTSDAYFNNAPNSNMWNEVLDKPVKIKKNSYKSSYYVPAKTKKASLTKYFPVLWLRCFKMSTIPVLQPRFMYGLRTDIKGNAWFIGDEEVLYPVGGILVVHNFTQKRQRFGRLPDRGRNVIRLLLSPNQKMLAVSERGERPSILLYDVATLKKKKQLQVPLDRGETAEEFHIMEFTIDSKTLIAVTGEPDWNMYVFRCDKGKVESSAKGNNPNNTGTVNQIACNPTDTSVIALVGVTVFKFMACSDKVWRQYGFAKSDNSNLSSARWLSQDRLIAGSVEGKFMIFEGGELKLIYWAGDLPFINLRALEKEEIQQQSSQTNISEPSAGSIHFGEDYEIRCLLTFPKGLAFAYLNGTVHFYEKDGPHRYKKRNVFKVPNNNIIREEADADNLLNEINFLDINISEERLVLTCKQNQLFTVRLWGVDMVTNPEVMFTEFGHALHHGNVGGLDVCAWKPIFITAGEWDRTLRVWNYENDTIELSKQFQEDIRGVSLHPSGLYAVVGFSDKLRFLNIMIDDFILLSLSWVRNDIRLISAGNEGAIYDWDINTQKRIGETIIKTCAFTGVVASSNGRCYYTIGSDGYIRQIADANVEREVLLVESSLGEVVLSNSDQMMFVAANEGIVYSVDLPILDTAEYLEFGAHSSTISKMAISYDDKNLITTSTDGVVVVWKILNAEGKMIIQDKDFVPSIDILITRVDLEDKIDMIRTLQLRLNELLTEHSYQMRNIEVIHNMKLKEVHEGYCVAIEDLKDKNEQLEAEHAQEISNMTVEMNNLRANHEQLLQKLDVSYNDKLIVEYDKYLVLENKMSQMRSKYDTELEELRQAKITSEESITNEFLQRLHEKEVQVEELLEETKAKTREHELIKQQIEDDADREIYELKTSHEKELKDEQDSNVRLKGETGIIKKKLVATQKEIDELKHTVYTMHNDQVKFQNVIVGLEKNIADMRIEILERDDTIRDKERRIYELKRKNTELEKFKFILDFKIKELKSQIEPRDVQIRDQTNQITDMVNELENLQKIIISLDIQLGELREKLSATDNELKREVVKNRAAKHALKTIRTDIHLISGYVQDPLKMAKLIKEMYHKYNADSEFAVTHAEEAEAKHEFLRQRDFLERTIKTLQQQVTKYSTAGGGDRIRLVEENSLLIEETNVLRKNLKSESEKKKKMESLLGVSPKYMGPKHARKRLNDAVTTAEVIHHEYQQQLADGVNTISALKDENTRLTSKILTNKAEESEIED